MEGERSPLRRHKRDGAILGLQGRGGLSNEGGKPGRLGRLLRVAEAVRLHHVVALLLTGSFLPSSGCVREARSRRLRAVLRAMVNNLLLKLPPLDTEPRLFMARTNVSCVEVSALRRGRAPCGPESRTRGRSSVRRLRERRLVAGPGQLDERGVVFSGPLVHRLVRCHRSCLARLRIAPKFPSRGKTAGRRIS